MFSQLKRSDIDCFTQLFPTRRVVVVVRCFQAKNEVSHVLDIWWLQLRPVYPVMFAAMQDREAQLEAKQPAPKGAFGQAYPQPRPSRPWLAGPSAAVSHGRVVPIGKHKAAERVDSDGLPMPGEAAKPPGVGCGDRTHQIMLRRNGRYVRPAWPASQRCNACVVGNGCPCAGVV